MFGLVAVGVALAAPAVATVPNGKYAIGDSVMLGAKEELNAYGIKVNAAVSRQFSAGVTIVKHRAAKGILPKKVIIHLGTNGYIATGACNAVVKAAGAHRLVWFVTIKVKREWTGPNNRLLKGCVASHANSTLIDWQTYSRPHPGWFWGPPGDKYHLNPTGQQKYAALIHRSI